MPPQRHPRLGRVSRVALAASLLLVLSQIGFRLSDARRASSVTRIACASNMRQLALALFQYEQDNDGRLPAYRAAPRGPDWREAVYPYVKVSEVYRCPSDQPAHGGVPPGHLPTSYGANRLRGKDGRPLPLTDPLPVAPSAGNAFRTILLVDMRGYGGPEWDMTSPAFLPGVGRSLYAHANGRLNCLFADGHVKALAPGDTLAPINLWARDNAPWTGPDLSNARAILDHAGGE